MKRIALLLTAFLCAVAVQAQNGDKPSYRCLPCGNACDKEEYSAAGKCAHCGMKLVQASTIRFREVLPAAICDYIEQHPTALLLDVRTRAEYEGVAEPNFGTLKGSINIPIQELAGRLPELEKYKGSEILVFCSHSYRSPQAAYLLTQQGFARVTNMAGGMSVVQDKRCKK